MEQLAKWIGGSPAYMLRISSTVTLYIVQGRVYTQEDLETRGRYYDIQLRDIEFLLSNTPKETTPYRDLAAFEDNLIISLIQKTPAAWGLKHYKTHHSALVRLELVKTVSRLEALEYFRNDPSEIVREYVAATVPRKEALVFFRKDRSELVRAAVVHSVLLEEAETFFKNDPSEYVRFRLHQKRGQAVTDQTTGGAYA